MVWLTLPGVDNKGPEVLQYFLADLRLCMVADELGGCASMSYIFLQCTEY
jgi:hypothetical protein